MDEDTLSICSDNLSIERNTEGEEGEKEDEKVLAEILETESFCYCLKPENIETAILIMQEEGNKVINTEFISCKMNNITRCVNLLLDSNLKYHDPKRLAFTDIFYRTRHELLHRGVQFVLNLPNNSSDIPFSDFGIDSNRTPDYIGRHSDSIVIIEVTATSSFEKGAQAKGLESAGFESKYRKEIDELVKKGENVKYYPIIFEMSTLTLDEYKCCLHELIAFFPSYKKKISVLDYIAKELKIITLNLRNVLSAPAALLFSAPISIKEDHSDLKFLYRKFETDEDFISYPLYDEQKISPKVYMKVVNSWDTLHYKVRRLDEDVNYKLVIDMVTNRVRFEEFHHGINKSDWSIILQTNLRKDAFNNTLLYFSGEYKSCLDSDSGYTYLVKKSQSHEISNTIKLGKALSISELGHDPLSVQRLGFNFHKYVVLSELNSEQKLYPNYYNEKFEDIYIGMLRDLDDYCYKEKTKEYNYNERPILLGENRISNYDITEVMKEMTTNYENVNRFDDSLPIKVKKVKQPFILPFAEITQTNYTTYKFKNVNFLNQVKNAMSKLNPFTTIIIDKVISPDYKFGEESNQPSEYLNKLVNQRSEINRKMTYHYKGYIKRINKISTTIPQHSDDSDCLEYNKLKETLPELNKLIDNQYKIEKIKRNISMLRLKTKNIKKTKDKPHVNDTFLTSLYKKEMLHFKDRTQQSTIEGVGLSESVLEDYKKTKKIIDKVIDLLPINCGNNPDSLIDLDVNDDCKLLKECKEYSIEQYKKIIMDVKDSYLGHSAAFVSRMAHSLLFYSQLPFNSDYIRVDNLGYKDVLLIVKGGKKIFKTKSSKMYRMIYPISKELVTLYVNPSVGPSSFEFFEYNGRIHLITPWMLLHESILNDALSFYSRITSFTILNSDPKIPYQNQYKGTAMNVLLAFHNRRQTETLLANMRYILLSTIGEFSSFSGIMTEFVGFNYDFFQGFIRNSIIIQYPRYFTQILTMTKDDFKGRKEINRYDIRNIFTNEKITAVDQLALMIYSTFLMTKAPYQRAVERANNLRGILKIHEEFDLNVGLNLNPKQQFDKVSVYAGLDSKKYMSEMFEHDFKIDPQFLTQLGIFADSYYKNRDLTEKIYTSWNRILSENWDNMATSTGLRGRLKDVENFWGKKGYFIVYKEIVDEPNYLVEVDKLLSENLTEDEKRKKLRDINQTFYEKIKKPAEVLVFHAVDKTQWRGGREIFVMDIDTKLEQQPIEKFMAELCKLLDNELISIPSDRRAQTIHHSIFEKDLPLKDVITYYLTLDCSKWAPKSIFIKFCLTILPMDVIPYSFKMHFMNYINKLYYKKIYFNCAEVEVLKNNPKYSKSINKFLIFDSKVNGYYILMPYSWVMGIFNYTSSFLHAINQKYMSYLITNTSAENFQEETSLVMFAHSDDSGGRISSTSNFLIQRGLVIYELGLKACNHLLSRKKSTVSKVYFEILSVIYMFKQLLALLPKFLGGIRFLPTDKGMAQDMLQSYSKSIEIMVAGGDFTISYIVQKIYSMLVWKFYMHTPPCKIDYEKPVQYLGMPDAHPLCVLLVGSDADIIRILHVKGEDYISGLVALVSNVFNTYNEEGPIRSIKFKIQIRNALRGFEEVLDHYSDILNDWSIKNVNFKTTPFSLLNFLSKLNDPGFVGSLMNESPIRRISRSYFLRIGLSVITKYGCKTLKFANEIINSFCLYLNKDISFVKLLNEVMPFEDYEEFNNNLTFLKKSAETNIKVLKMSNYNIIKIYNYFDQLTLEGKTFMNTTRTLKPTHLEMIKTNKAFSVDFQPSQLVSYAKNSQFKWALPNVSNLNSALIELEKLLEIYNLNLDNIDESTLMKLLNLFSGKSVKDIYLYSHVPSEIRTMRTYSSLLSFLSVNLIKGKEISGLVLKLQSDLTDPGYLPLQIEENVYILNTFLISLMTISKIYGWNFLSKLRIRKNKILNNDDMLIDQFLEFCFKTLNENNLAVYINPIINYIIEKIKWPNRQPTGAIFTNGAYYIFTKSQKSSAGWYGKGEILIVIGNDFFRFEILNNSIAKCYTNVDGKLSKLLFDYIIDVLTSNDIYVMQKDLKPGSDINTDYGFGYDFSGDLRISQKREIKNGIECVYQSGVSGEISHLNTFYIEHLEDNNFLAIQRGVGNFPNIKIKTIKILKGELINTLKILLDENDFKEKLLENGFDDFGDFLLTEVLTHFGGENYIDFIDFIDNCQSSRLYEIMKWSQENISSQEDEEVTLFSTMPGAVGSLTNLFLRYGDMTNNWVIKMPKLVNRAIMNMRSEYPESFTLILNEKLNECYDNLFNPEEKIEIKQAYIDLITSTNESEIRQKLINLMCYWGYASLVNTIQCFTMLQKDYNYNIFRISSYDLKEESLFSDLFVTLLNILNDEIMKFAHLFRKLKYPSQRLMTKHANFEDIIINNIKGITASLYKGSVYICSVEIYTLKFLNVLCALFKEPEFLINLNDAMSDKYPLSLLPINQENLENFVASYNVLKTIWSKVNKVDYGLNFTKMVERLPNNVTPPNKIFRMLTDKTSPADSYFHGFLNREFVNSLNSFNEFNYRGTQYKLEYRLSELSDTAVPLIKGLTFNYPLTDEVLESANWEDIVYETEMTDIDYDTINELWEEFDVKFVEPETVIEENYVEAVVKWVIEIGKENSLPIDKYMRQVGEFVVLITTRVGILTLMPNCHVREIYIKTQGKYKSNLLAYVILPEGVDPGIIDKLFGKNQFNVDFATIEELHVQTMRTPEGLTTSTHLGVNFDKLEEEGEVETEEDAVENERLNTLMEKKNEIKSIVNEAIAANPSCESIYNKLLDKYVKNLEKGLSLTSDALLESLIAELDLNDLKENFIAKTSAELTKEQIISINLSPGHFGITKKGNGYAKPVNYKDKKVKAELESFEQTLADKLGSGTLTISPKYRKIILANLEIWKNYVEHSSYKQESKKFLWNFINKVCVDAMKVDTDEDDDLWRELIDKCVTYIADTGEDLISRQGKQFKLSLRQGARLKYRHKGT